jgi:hypothetical protein
MIKLVNAAIGGSLITWAIIDISLGNPWFVVIDLLLSALNFYVAFKRD